MVDSNLSGQADPSWGQWNQTLKAVWTHLERHSDEQRRQTDRAPRNNPTIAQSLRNLVVSLDALHASCIIPHAACPHPAKSDHQVQDRQLHPSFLATGFQLPLPTRLWLLYTLAAASFLTTLHLPYIGEEAVYTITSMEMWTQRDFLVPTLFGSLYGRPPLYNWLIIPLANLFGWDHVLVAARLPS
jgi:hypothetical protein